MSSSYAYYDNNNTFYSSDSEEEVGDAAIVHDNYFDSSDEEEKQDAATIVVLAAVATTVIMASSYTQGQLIRHVRDQLEWNLHVRQLQLEEGDAFCRLYRMSHASFVKLCTLHMDRPFPEGQYFHVTSQNRERSYYSRNGTALPVEVAKWWFISRHSSECWNQ